MNVGRNALCPCGSGKKHKRCCGQRGSGPPQGQTHSGPKSNELPSVELALLANRMQAGAYLEAETRALELAAQYPNVGLVWKFLAISREIQGKPALDAWQRAAKLLPGDAESLYNLANVLGVGGRWEEAQAGYRRALQVNPEFAVAHFGLAAALRQLGQLEAAAASYRRGLQLQPAMAGAHTNLGNVLLQLGRLQEAVTSYRAALEIEPESAETHCNLGAALLKLGRPDEASMSLQRAVELRGGFALAHSNLGQAQQQLGQLREAEESYRRALTIEPLFADAHTNLGNVLRDLGQIDAALLSHRRALALRPDFLEAQINLGNALLDAGQLDAAVACYRSVIESSPGFASAHRNLGNALRNLGQIEAAEGCFRRALALDCNDAEAYSSLAVVLRLQNRLADAEAHCRKALEINPNSHEALSLVAELQADRGEFAAAEALFRRAISVRPNHAHALAGIANLRKMSRSDAAWAREAQSMADQALPPRQEIQLRYALGKYFDDVGDYGQAFNHYHRANELTKRCRPGYDASSCTRQLDAIAQRYPASGTREMQAHGEASPRPVFIVGMPRSGTSLAEQILASHRAVHGAGELPFWTHAAAKCLASGARVDLLRESASEYLQLLDGLSQDALRVIDKMPANFLHLGLIHAALPEARIVHMRRNPLDTCLSIYFQDFDVAHAYANDLEDLAHYYRQYLRLMQHWRSVLPAHALLEVPYEALVEDQEAWSRKMVQFVGLPWDPRCLEFDQTSRIVATRSRWQVRQKIDNSSIERWRHYTQHIRPLYVLLDDAPLET